MPSYVKKCGINLLFNSKSGFNSVPSSLPLTFFLLVPRLLFQGKQLVLVSAQRAAGASRSVTELLVLWLISLCLCTEPCDYHVAKCLAKSRWWHLGISVCVA